MKEELIAPCGMNCAVCSSYLARQKELKEKGVRLPYCAGCRPREKQCAFLKKRCNRLLQHEVKYCYQCPDFPCGNLKHIDARYQKLYRLSLIQNLETIRDQGIAQLLLEQQKQWQCPRCGGTISCHNGICYNCELDRLKKQKSPYRWENV